MKEDINNSLLDTICRTVQDCLSTMPVIVLGSGHSCNYDLPNMDGLARHLLLEIPKQLSEEDRGGWSRFTEKVQQGASLEAALQKVHLSQQLLNLIVKETWSLIFPVDRGILEQVAVAPRELPLSRLYRHLFRSTHMRLQVVTTNYDCLAEYAADLSDYLWSTGFRYGYIGDRYGNRCPSFFLGQERLRMVQVWKVHGSIDWYRSPDNTVIALPALMAPPKEYVPAIVTPGTDKYRQTHEEPFRTIIAGADTAIEAGNSFFCVGYGFNDDHIQPKLLERCRKQEKIIVVLAKKLTDAARRVFMDGHCKHYIAFEESALGTAVYTPELPDGVELQGTKLWSLEDLLNEVL